MEQNKVMIIGGKESFIIRVLLKKLEEAEIEATFTAFDLNRIHQLWDETSLVTFYMEKNDRFPDDIKTFLVDHMENDDKNVILIGEPADVELASEGIPSHLIYKSLPRPLDYDSFISCVNSYTSKASCGELKKRILVVDDDPNFVNLVREWMKDDYKVSVATSGMQAIKWLGHSSVDLILLDYEMPVTNGPQVLEMLRSEEETKNIPVIFLTGNDSKESVMSVVSLKPQGYFLKTMPREEFMNKIKMFFASQD